MKRYLVLAAVAAAAAFLAGPLLVHRSGPARARLSWDDGADYEGYRRPARVDAQWRERHGHAFSIEDRPESGVPRLRPMPGGCLDCHAATGAARPRTYYEQASARPLGCLDCHERGGSGLRLTRPALVAGRRENLRVLVCAQCHGEYYFQNNVPVRPWARGLRVEEIEAYYDALGYSDFEDPETGAPLLAIRHPQFEMWSQGTHAASGAGCADCHMPRVRRGAMRVTDHQGAKPLNGQACLACHAADAAEMRARANLIRKRTEAMAVRAERAIAALAEESRAALARGAAPAALAPVRALHRRARLRLDFVRADGSRGFHAPQEALRLLAEAVDFARQGQLLAAAQ